MLKPNNIVATIFSHLCLYVVNEDGNIWLAIKRNQSIIHCTSNVSFKTPLNVSCSHDGKSNFATIGFFFTNPAAERVALEVDAPDTEAASTDAGVGRGMGFGFGMGAGAGAGDGEDDEADGEFVLGIAL